MDLPMFGCSVMVDGKTVIENGEIVDPGMKVEPTYPLPLCL